MTLSYADFFQKVTGNPPRHWQSDLAADPRCVDRMIYAGTGLGKTLAVLLAWAYHRQVIADPQTPWPRRLVWCLPMRVLVEQTAAEAQKVLAIAAEVTGAASPVPVHTLMGGVNAQDDWHLYPNRSQVFIVTQDMGLSRALNRGYAAAPARWPMEFALFNRDVLWVYDEVQIQGVGAVTGAQLQTFRHDERKQCGGPASHSWWMSATLRSRWINTVDSQSIIEAADEHRVEVPHDDKDAPVYTAQKPVTIQAVPGKIKDVAADLASLIAKQHHEADPVGRGRLTLAVFNTVAEAVAVDSALANSGEVPDVELCLIHSRFRGRDRAAWREGNNAILSRASCENPQTNRIILATQIVEAGVDIGATSLVTELAPWPSLVQRFGRAARYGGTAQVVVVDRQKADKSALPYEADDLAAAAQAVSELTDVGLQSLETLDQLVRSDSERDAALFRFNYIHQLQRADLEELFDTSTDLTGEDIDVSRFIREGEDVNVQIAWYDAATMPPPIEDNQRPAPPPRFRPIREDVCPIPFLAAKTWLAKDKATSGKHYERCEGNFAFVWSFEDDAWLPLRRGGQIRPGATVLVDARVGGYDSRTGFTGDSPTKSYSFPSPLSFEQPPPPASVDESGANSDPNSIARAGIQSIADHGGEVRDGVATLFDEAIPELHQRILKLAAELHDYGKCHPAFRCNLRIEDSHWSERDDIAKAPGPCWESSRSVAYSHPEASGTPRFAELGIGKRTGFRHELASMLGVAELFASSGHPSLQGEPSGDQPRDVPARLTQLVEDISNDDVALLLYLIVAHHGKVRAGLHRSVHDQEFKPPKGADSGLPPIRGVRDNDTLPPIAIQIEGQTVQLPTVILQTDLAAMGWSPRYGASFTERLIGLTNRVGMFNLAYLETLLRSADIRISRDGLMGEICE